ncbi:MULTISPECIES: TonB-dependent receptor [Pseudomonas]|uniref:TonB-dependent receptor n=1 Tax=Pseudomonas TaxID=286 RepID=UPI000AF09607|nr:TonB-dependent receptor [Pseudomonas sp. PI1]
MSAGTNSFKYIRAGYALWNTLVEYHIDKHWSAALNGNDLFDKSNYQTVATCDHDNC